jgi:signal transduction histidine kinase/PAS domain-containing protein
VYTGKRDWLTPRRRAALFGYYGLIAAVTMFDPLLHVTISDWSMTTYNGITFVTVTKGPLYDVILIATYPAVVASFWLLGRFLVSPRNIYRVQTGVILCGLFFTFLGNLLFESGVVIHPGLRLSPVFFAINGLFIALALFYYDFLDVEPLAPDVVLQEIKDAVLVLDEDDRLVDGNPAARHFFDGPVPTGDHVTDVHPVLLEAARSGEEYEHDGTVHDPKLAPIEDQYGQDRGSVLVLRDITVQKRRERTLDSLQSVSERFLRAETEREVGEIAVETAVEVLGYRYSGLLLSDPRGDGEALVPVALADPVLEMAHDAPSDVPTVPVTSLDGSETVDVPVVEPGENTMWQAYESGEPVLGEEEEVCEGETVSEELGATLLFPLGDHGVLGITGGPTQTAFSADDRRFARTLASATRNALDRVEKETQLRESRELLEQRTEQMEFFNSVLRHDLLNGMMVIRGHLDQLGEHVDETGRAHVETIDEWSDDIATLAQKVRSVTKTVTGETAIELEPVVIGPALERKVEKVERTHEDVTVSLDVDAGGTVLGDDLLPAVIENVLANAIEHNDTDTPELHVQTRPKADALEVRIADNGPGIPDTLKDTVFEKQVTSEDSGSVGFGLYFVSVMMNLYGGSVWFEDNDPRGAVAVLSFPLASDQAGEPVGVAED